MGIYYIEFKYCFDSKMKSLILLVLVVVSTQAKGSPRADPADADLKVPELIKKYGYPEETHFVTTSDGYILQMHRIPHGKDSGPEPNKKVALLQHGLLSSSADWIITGPKAALAYILADAGYDVWLANSRGNRYSRNHTSLNPDFNSLFWQFSWHEIGKIDLPAQIDHILNKTGVEQIYYAGHSQGTTVFYVMASERPEYNSKIKVQVSLSPIAFMSHLFSPLMHVMALWESTMQVMLPFLGINEFYPDNTFMSLLGNTLCLPNTPTQILCTNSMFAVSGFSPEEMDTELLPILMAHTPAGCSTRQMLHYGQEMNSGHFRQYDYGIYQNLIEYGSMFPPDYDLSKITAPVYMLYSTNDWLAAETDISTLCNKLPNCLGEFLVASGKFNHLDFIYGIHAPKYVYPEVLSVFERF